MSESKSILIPRNRTAWRKLAARHGASDMTVNTIRVMKSGSLVTPQQFLTFRVIWPDRKEPKHFYGKKEREDSQEMAKIFKQNRAFNESFETYLTGITRNWGPADVTGVFQLVRKYQMQVDNQIPTKGSTDPMSTNIRMSPTPTPGPATSSDGSRGSQPPVESSSKQSDPSQSQTPAAEPGSSRAPTESSSASTDSHGTPAAEQEGKIFERTTDEQYVNQALITFLDAVTVNLPEVKCHWGIRRLPFKVEFALASMEAHTDGYLYGLKANNEAFAIVETKAHSRKRRGEGSRIYMQESAEMVAWIFRDANDGREVPLKDNRQVCLSLGIAGWVLILYVIKTPSCLPRST
ncbi:hypothetical protein Aspvir_007568 [Aspergillus viridinutans]|uniref:Uncharacterized protein n=1 Tax=Aspergillus viridinutans TaxID=75553 RepID=A0A9P3C186_ASPVI|nr:uncharacterized protein Aspvir_007568 [Aspergillus viridinutans]GIK03496.1 hypothetical protein Aspvir_007568 [Aspergillus viridinutans]